MNARLSLIFTTALWGRYYYQCLVYRKRNWGSEDQRNLLKDTVCYHQALALLLLLEGSGEQESQKRKLGPSKMAHQFRHRPVLSLPQPSSSNFSSHSSRSTSSIHGHRAGSQSKLPVYFPSQMRASPSTPTPEQSTSWKHTPHSLKP